MNRVRYAVIGTTGIGEAHVRLAAKNDRVDLAALVDTDEGAVRRQSDLYHVPAYTDYREMIRSVEVDAVSICTPNHLHAPMAGDCLAAGKHVFVEKPLAMRFADGKRLVDSAREKDLHICVGHQYRLHRTARTMKKILDDGEIGRVTRVLWSWNAFRNHRYFTAAPWRSSWQTSGGGVLSHTASHELDLIAWLLGRVKRVSAMLSDQVHGAGLDDLLCANLYFESGAVGTLQVSINERDRFSVRQVSGDRGMIVIEDYRSHTFDHKDVIRVGRYEQPLDREVAAHKSLIHQPEIRWRREPLVGDQPGWQKQFQKVGLWKPRPRGLEVLMNSFIDAVLVGGEPLVTGESALHAVELMNAVLVSAARRRDVELPTDPADMDGLFEELDRKKGGAAALGGDQPA